MNTTKILLAGLGGYGENYVRELLEPEDPSDPVATQRELAAVADPFAEKSPWYEKLKSRGIPVFSTVAEFFKEHRADLTVISSPIHTHYAYIMAGLDAGSAVLCEKPVCTGAEQMDALIQKEKETGLFVAVGYQLCFSRDVLALKKDILDGLFGRPLGFKALCLPRRGTRYYRRNSWAGKIQVEGERILDSPLNNACAHEMQLMLFLLGATYHRAADVLSVEAELWRARPDIENYDAVAVKVKTDRDTPLLFYTAHCVEESMTGPMGEFRFEKATIRWRENGGEDFIAYFNDGTVKSYGSINKGKYLQKLYDAVEAARGGDRPSCTLETVRGHQKCVNLVQEFPVTVVPTEKLGHVTGDDGDDYYFIPGFVELLSQCYREDKLPRGFKI